MTNLAVVNTAYQTAARLGASRKVMLALFEACIVESNFENLNYGDRDSLGVLQQRANWGSRAERLNVASSVTKFVNRAKAIENRYTLSSQLAQAVQVSAFPGRYALVRPQAEGLLAQAQINNGSAVPNTPAPNDPSGGLGSWDSSIQTITNPHTYLRIAMFILGGIMVLFALAKMTGNNELSPTTKALAKGVTKAAGAAVLV
jgi:hypothetical protein